MIVLGRKRLEQAIRDTTITPEDLIAWAKLTIPLIERQMARARLVHFNNVLGCDPLLRLADHGIMISCVAPATVAKLLGTLIELQDMLKVLC